MAPIPWKCLIAPSGCSVKSQRKVLRDTVCEKNSSLTSSPANANLFDIPGAAKNVARIEEVPAIRRYSTILAHFPSLQFFEPQQLHPSPYPSMEPILLAIFRNLQVKELFGEIEGMVSWRLSIQKDGVSRGFGFAEFKTPEGALERWEAGDAIGVFFF